jgi:hypothetical protein
MAILSLSSAAMSCSSAYVCVLSFSKMQWQVRRCATGSEEDGRVDQYTPPMANWSGRRGEKTLKEGETNVTLFEMSSPLFSLVQKQMTGQIYLKIIIGL